MTIEILRFPGSSMLVDGEYDSETQQLTVTFQNGDTYASSGAIPQGIVEGLKAAGSAGKYFHRNIRSRYGFVPV